MVTIFAIPKSFQGHSDVIQKNAIRSWMEAFPECEVILFGNDPGVAEAAKELGTLNIPEVEKNEYGTPLLNSAFNIAQQTAKNNILVYINSDIILTTDFSSAIKMINFPMFLASGRRIDLDLKGAIDFNDREWEKKIREKTLREGKLHGFSGIDYFVFPRNFSHNLPAFAVGRVGWDNWLIYHTRSLKIPVIDITKVNMVIHQSHDYLHSPFGEKNKVGGPEFKKSLELAGGLTNMCTLRDADWILTNDGLEKPSLLRRALRQLSLFYPWRLILAFKRRLFS